MGRIFKKIVNIYKKKGAIGVLRKIREFLSERVYFRKLIWNEIDISLPVPSAKLKKPIDIIFCIDSKQEVMEWIKYNFYDGYSYPDEALINKIAIENNHIFPCIKVNNEIVGFMKVGFNRVYIRNFHKILELHEENAYVCETYIAPEYRNIGLATIMRMEILKFLKEKGVKKLYNYIHSNNVSSLRVSAKCGGRIIGSIWQFRVFRLTVLFDDFPTGIFKV